MRALPVCSVLLLLSLSLTACGGTDDDPAAACVDRYWDGQVGTCLPDGWGVVSRERIAERGLPPEVVAGFERTEEASGQAPVVIVTREMLPSGVETEAYSDASIRSVTTLPGYAAVDTLSQTIDEADVQIHVYTAQPQPEEPARRFYQLSTIAGGIGYTFTGLTPFAPDRALEEEILVILRNATFMEPVEE